VLIRHGILEEITDGSSTGAIAGSLQKGVSELKINGIPIAYTFGISDKILSSRFLFARLWNVTRTLTRTSLLMRIIVGTAHSNSFLF
jgi:hypothetical protein